MLYSVQSAYWPHHSITPVVIPTYDRFINKYAIDINNMIRIARIIIFFNIYYLLRSNAELKGRRFLAVIFERFVMFIVFILHDSMIHEGHGIHT